MITHRIRPHGRSAALAFLAAAVLSLAALVSPASAQVPNTLLYSVPPPAGIQSGAQMGRAVATDGVRTVVGSHLDDTSATNAGLARVYDAVTGALLFVLPNPAPASNDNFGDAVAISGNRVVVGAPADDLGAGDAGTAYVFDLAGGDPTVPVTVLSSPAPQAGGNFGHSVSISGALVVVGAHDYDTPVDGAGRAWVFDLNSPTPTVPVQTLDKPVAVADDRFGISVAISGTKIVVGADRDDTGAATAGIVYVFDLGNGTPIYTLNNPTPQTADYFGQNVAISGSYVAISAPNDNTGSSDAGSVYVYNLAGATPAIPLATVNNPSPASADFFGISLALSGSRMVVGAYLDDTGATDAGSAYVYDLTTSSATLAFSLFNPTPGTGDRFGSNVAISGSTVVVGAHLDDDLAPDAGAAYSYNLAGGTPTTPVLALKEAGPSIIDEFGVATAVSGNRLVVGALFNDTDAPNGGIVYVYDLAGGTPAVPALTIHNPDPGTDDVFGSALALSGSMLAVSAAQDSTTGTQAGAVYVYDLSSATPTVPVYSLYEPVPSSQFGFSVDISGMRVVVGANFSDIGATDAGSAYVFDLASATPTTPAFTLNNPSPAADDRFGRVVGISGTRVVVGTYFDDATASNSGTAYVYDLTSGSPTVPAATLNNPSPAANDWFGRSVSISGSRVVVAAWQDDTGANDAGSVYVYDVSSGTPATPIATLNNPEAAASDQFGGAVDISGTRILIGAYLDEFGASNSGSVYQYDLSSGTPLIPVATFRNPTPGVDDQFGHSVCIDSTFFSIGAHFDDTAAPDKGYAYVYGPPPEIVVEQPAGTILTDGSASISFGDFQFTSTPVRTFTVRNTGVTSLLGLGVTKGGANAGDFVIDVTSLGTFITPGASATFTVTMTPASAGMKTATLQISSTDLDENPFDISIGGQSYSATTDTDADGMNDWQEFQLSALGFNWQVPNTALVNTYFATARQNGLYTAAEVQDLNVGTPLLQRNPTTGLFTLTLGLERSTTLGAWVPLPLAAPQAFINGDGKLEFQFTTPEPTVFFRLHAQ